MAACRRFTQWVWKSFVANKGHDANCFPSLEITKVSPNSVSASLVIQELNLNRAKTLHGGTILSLTDTLGSLAVATRGQYMTGVSTDIGASFVKPAGRVGETIHMTGKLISMGKTLAYTRVEFTNSAGELVAFGHHTKFVGKTLDHPKNVKFTEDGETVIEGNANFDVD